MGDDKMKALWVVLDADDSNQIMMDEFSNFLRGKPAPPKKVHTSRPASRSPSKRKLLPEEAAAIKERADVKYRAIKEEQRRKALHDSAMRLQREKEREQAARLEKKLRLGKARLDMQY